MILEWRDGFWVGMNYTFGSYTFDIPNSANILIGKPELHSAGVVIWME